MAICRRSAASPLSLGSSGASCGSWHGRSRLASIVGLTDWKELPQAVRSSTHGRRLSAIARDRCRIDLLRNSDDLGFGVGEFLGELLDGLGVGRLVFLGLCDDGVRGVELRISGLEPSPEAPNDDAG